MAAKGSAELGDLQLTDRSGKMTTVDLSGTETLDGVVQAINDNGKVGITAQVNAARQRHPVDRYHREDGEQSHCGQWRFDQHRHQAPTHDQRRGHRGQQRRSAPPGRLPADETRGPQRRHGVAQGTLTVTNSLGASDTVDLSQGDIKTVGDLIDAINNLNLNVQAGINATGDGIALTDFAGGHGTLTVQDPSSSAVANLHLTGTVDKTTVNGQPAQVLDGSTTVTISLDSGDSLTDLQSKIAAAGGGVTARSSPMARPGRTAWSCRARTRATTPR